jgi:hypothetical protein
MKNDDHSQKKHAFIFLLKGSFLSVLLLIQVPMIGLSIAFCYLMISNLKDAEERRTQNVTKHIQNEVKHRIYRSLLVTLNVAHDPETIEAFRKTDREALLKVTADTWKQLQTYSITQFHFHIPTPQGIVGELDR